MTRQQTTIEMEQIKNELAESLHEAWINGDIGTFFSTAVLIEETIKEARKIFARDIHATFK